MINNDQLKLVVMMEVGVIVALLIILVANGPLTSGSGNAVDRDPRIDFNMDHEVRVIEKELFVKNISGSEIFVVDQSWSAIGIYVEGLTSSYVSWSVTYPGFPEGALTVNGTSFPFAEMARERIDGNTMGTETAIYGEPMGNWTLNYNVEEGSVKISIVKVRFIA